MAFVKRALSEMHCEDYGCLQLCNSSQQLHRLTRNCKHFGSLPRLNELLTVLVVVKISGLPWAACAYRQSPTSILRP